MTSIKRHKLWNRRLVSDVDQFLQFPDWWAPVSITTAPIVLQIAVLIDQYQRHGRKFEEACNQSPGIDRESFELLLIVEEHALRALGMEFWRLSLGRPA